METLRELALDGHTVICSIHQPRGSVYGKFDDIVLLTDGALVYAGPAQKKPLEYFSNFGYIVTYTNLWISEINKSLHRTSVCVLLLHMITENSKTCIAFLV